MTTGCHSKKQEYQRNKESYLKRAKKNYRKSLTTPDLRLRRMLIEAKSRAKKKGLEFSIIQDDVKWNTKCPLLNLDIVLHNEGYGGKDTSPSLDRIDNSKGYIKGNVRIVSNRANKLKNSMTREECYSLWENWYCI